MHWDRILISPKITPIGKKSNSGSKFHRNIEMSMWIRRQLMSQKEECISVHQSLSIVFPTAFSSALTSKVVVHQGSYLNVEVYTVPPLKHPIVSDGVKDFLYIFI